MNLYYYKRFIEIVACEKCGSDKFVQRHRINPSGPYTVDNVEILCDKCHKEAHKKIERRRFKTTAYRKG